IQEHAELVLSDITFTCQLGRQAMDYRLAIVADSRELLLQRLESFVDNRLSTGISTAQVKRSLETDTTLFDAHEDAQSLLSISFQKKKLEKIAQVWVRGVHLDWMILYRSAQGAIPTGAGQNPRTEATQGTAQGLGGARTGAVGTRT